MDFRETLTTLLPTPRDDEPANLRQDIVDELADHLACAYNRELLRGANSQVARQRVLERFGDPAAVARRLWFDAMKGKIMAQRVVIVTCLLVAMASLSLVGIVWIQSSRVAAEALEANRQFAAALAQSQILSKDMMKTLSEMSDAIRNPRSPDWNPVKIKLTEDSTEGPPAAGWSISLQRSNSTIDRTTDESGVADFGLLHPGTYSYSLSRNRKYGSPNGSGQLSVDPGSNIKKLIIFPRKALSPVPVRISCNWPADLEKERLVVDAQFNFDGLEFEGTGWSTFARSVFCGPGAELREILDAARLFLWATASEHALRADILTSHVRTINESAEPLRLERGSYRLFELMVLRPLRGSGDHAERQQFELLTRCIPWQLNWTYEIRDEPPTEYDLKKPRNIGGSGMQMGQQGLVISQQSWASIATGFEARPDHANDWTIKFPSELIDFVRAKLRAEKAGKSE